MPPRLNKRQLREQQELQELERAQAASSPAVEALPEEHEVDSSEEEQVVSQPRAAQGGFGALLDDGDDEPEEDEVDEPEQEVQAVKSKKSKNKKKKKKAPARVAMPGDEDAEEELEAAAVDSLVAPATPSGGGGGKKKKKGKGGGGGGGKAMPTPAKKKADDGLDEIDRALAELKTRDLERGVDEKEIEAKSGRRVDPVWARVKEVYAFDPKHLDAEAELRRFFGSKVIGSSGPSTPRPSHLHARLANNPHHAASLRRSSSFLAQPEAGWPSPNGVVGLERYDGPEAEEEKARGGAGEWWTFVHSPSYKQAQLMFLEVLQQADGNRLYDVLAALPYHVDTHMQLSEMMAQQGDLGASSTHLTRALYALSSPLPPTFPSGSFRLPYSQIENRALYLGIARKVALLVKRGTWRTAFEWAKIGLGLGGGSDPVGMLCWIDFLAPKAGQQAWFFNLLSSLDAAYPEMRFHAYPGLAFAKALCVRNEEEEAKDKSGEKSLEALKSAILRFPVVATLLSNALAFDLPPAMVTHRRAQPDGSFTRNPSYLTSLLSELYVARAAPLWKDPISIAWLQKAIRAAAPLLDDRGLEDVRVGEELWEKGAWEEGTAPEGVIRAAFMSDLPSIRPYLPPSARQGTTYSYDPLPPQAPHATFYSDQYFASLYAAGSYRRRGREAAQQPPGQAGGRGAADLAAAMRDGLARLLGVGADGGAVALNPELRDELMRELEMLNGGGMPGGFREEGGDDGEWDDEEDEGEEDGGGEGREEANLNLLGRLGALFGGGGAAGGGGAGAAPQ
ncbi:hypothetical protein JCM8097_004014 [Rhodosporidiobolus ruineniae]